MSPTRFLCPNYKRLKLTALHAHLGQINNKIQKGQNPASTSEAPGAKAWPWACPLHTASPKEWADHLSHSSGPTHHDVTTLKPFKKLFPATPFPASGSKQGNLLLVLTLLICSPSPGKALPEFLIWHFINFYCVQEPWWVIPLAYQFFSFQILLLPHFYFAFSSWAYVTSYCLFKMTVMLMVFPKKVKWSNTNSRVCLIGTCACQVVSVVSNSLLPYGL